MDDMQNDVYADEAPSAAEDLGAGGDRADGDDQQAQPSDLALIEKITRRIKTDKKHHEKAFKRMRRDMYIAMHGSEKEWGEDKYRANISGSHVKQKTDSLYAKNPKVTHERSETLDFAVWDESDHSLMLAMQTMQQAAMASAQPPMVDGVTGAPVQPAVPPGFEQAQALIADFEQGMQRRQQIKKFGRTLEVLFANAMRGQSPLDFKESMKQVTRRACTTGVGYCRLGFQKEMGPRSGIGEKIADHQQRIAHLQRLQEEAQEGEISDTDAELAELQAALQALQSEPEIVLRSGLVFDFPLSTAVIPDKLCKQLVGFVGAKHLTIEYKYTKNQIKEIFNVDIGSTFVPYTVTGDRGDGVSGGANYVDESGQGDFFNGMRESEDSLVCAWEHFDHETGLVYWLVDGFKGWLKPPAPPEVDVQDFWPLYALTFNAVESETELFPESDVSQMLGTQNEVNRSRQGKREHRDAARPRWAYSNGAFDDEDVELLKTSKAFEAIGLGMDPSSKIADLLQPIPVPGVDPNLYDTNEVMADANMVVSAGAENLGGISKGTATSAAISANSTAARTNSGIDEMDSFLSRIARGGSQILVREMTEEQVTKIAGPGAVWLPISAPDIAEQVYLTIEAGSSGKPNQAIEMENWQKMLPFLIQIGSIPPTWLARETLRRLDDRMDLTEAVVDGLPSIVAMNAQKQPGPGDPASDPNAQGGKGGQNGPQAPGGPSGSSAPMGDNNDQPKVIRYGSNGQRMQ